MGHKVYRNVFITYFYYFAKSDEYTLTVSIVDLVMHIFAAWGTVEPHYNLQLSSENVQFKIAVILNHRLSKIG